MKGWLAAVITACFAISFFRLLLTDGKLKRTSLFACFLIVSAHLCMPAVALLTEQTHEAKTNLVDTTAVGSLLQPRDAPSVEGALIRRDLMLIPGLSDAIISFEAEGGEIVSVRIETAEDIAPATRAAILYYLKNGHGLDANSITIA